MTLETYISTVNSFFYLREFSFSRNQFTPQQKSELEFSDNVVWLDDLLITIQIKERKQLDVHTIENEIKWFKNTVLKHATKQIRDTLRYLNTYSKIEITNERGHSFDVVSGSINKKIHIVLYSPNEILPNEYKWKKFYLSSTAGFIHLITAEDYFGICRTLITPAEIREYLEFRQKICSKCEDRTNNLPEQSLLGQFLAGELVSEPRWDYTEYLLALTTKLENFDLSRMLHKFLEKTVKTFYEPLDYYRILKELAKLKRTELKEVKERLLLCINKSQEDQIIKPYRVTILRTGCGFVFCIVPKEMVGKSIIGLKNYTYAHKYDQKLTKCIGISVYRDGDYLDIGWCLIEEEWFFDEVMEKKLKDSFPFREVKMKKNITYHFNQLNQ
jgi:hypothetical protein